MPAYFESRVHVWCRALAETVMCSFLCCHFDFVILRLGKLILREDDVSQNVCSVMSKLKVTRCY